MSTKDGVIRENVDTEEPRGNDRKNKKRKDRVDWIEYVKAIETEGSGKPKRRIDIEINFSIRYNTYRDK